MPTIALEVRCPGRDADELFAIFSDFEGHVERAPVVRDVRVGVEPDGRRTSAWEVDFQDGVLQWSEWDEVDVAGRAIRFERRGGDPAAFEGAWSVVPEQDGCRIRLQAEFDLGVATFASVLDPLALQALRDSMVELAASVADGRIEIVEERLET